MGRHACGKGGPDAGGGAGGAAFPAWMDGAAAGILAIQRHYFQSFAFPASQGWMHAHVIAEERFGGTRGAVIAVATLAQVQAMRQARSGTFRFNDPLCPACRLHLTGEERLLSLTLAALRRGDGDAARAKARAHATILCEGAPVDRLLAATAQLAGCLGAVPAPTTAAAAAGP
jgi:hypothetical protein